MAEFTADYEGTFESFKNVIATSCAFFSNRDSIMDEEILEGHIQTGINVYSLIHEETPTAVIIFSDGLKNNEPLLLDIQKLDEVTENPSNNLFDMIFDRESDKDIAASILSKYETKDVFLLLLQNLRTKILFYSPIKSTHIAIQALTERENNPQASYS